MHNSVYNKANQFPSFRGILKDFYSSASVSTRKSYGNGVVISTHNHSSDIRTSHALEHINDGKSDCKTHISSDSSFDKEPVQINNEDETKVKVYKMRIWILGIFSYLAFYQTVIWGTFGPIMKSAECAFGWHDDVIAIFQSLSPVAIVLTIVPMTWFTQSYGPRKGMLFASLCMMLGTGIRCITSSDTAFTALAILGGVLNGVAGCIALGLPPLISALWFPSQERTTATAVGALAAQMGGAGMYLSPLLVQSPGEGSTNSSGGNGDCLLKEDIKGDIMELMYIEFGIALILFLCILIHFPDRPRQPPSDSSKIERIEYFSSIKTLSRNSEYLIVMATYMFSFGVPVVWISVMNFSLECIDIDQDQVMWIGIAACFGCAFSSVIVARITDLLHGYMKFTIIGLLLLSSLFFLWYLLLVSEVITPSLGQVYVAIIGGYSFEYATVPLLIELGVELAYPCSETVVGASFTGSFSFVAMIFLFLFIIPTECYFWAGYVLVACTALPTIPLFLVKEKHKRSTIDRK